MPLGMMVMQGSSLALPDFLLTSILAALAMAGGLAGLTAIYVRFVPRSRLSVAGLVLVVAVATITGGIGLLAVSAEFPHGKWRRLADPPMPLADFAGPTCYRLTSDPHVVFGTTLDGRYLSYGPTSRDGWAVQSSLPTSSPEDVEWCNLSTSEMPPRMPDDVLEMHSVREVGADCGGTSHYVLKTDGSVWELSRFTCAIGVAVAFFIYLGLLVAISVGAGFGCTSDAVRWHRDASLSENNGQGAF